MSLGDVTDAAGADPDRGDVLVGAPDDPPASLPAPTTELVDRMRTESRLRRAFDLLVVSGCALFVFWQLHPDLILADTTPAGGDMGAHVWAFSYLRDTLLPAGQWSGWAPDWYAGFPAFQFYMVVPFLGMVLLNAGVGGIGAIGVAAVSLVASLLAGGVRRFDRQLVGGIVSLALLALGFGLWHGFNPSWRFTLMVACSIAAGVAIVHGRGSRWLGAAAMVVALGGISLPFGAAFKVVAVSGVVAMPATAYVFGRLARLPHPAPPLLSVALLGFLFDTNFSIYGGNIASTMAGEFAFSISLALSLAYLGVVVHGLRTGSHRVTAGVLLALVGLCHLIPAFFALAATAVLLGLHMLAEPEERRDRAERLRIPVAIVLAIVIVAAVVSATTSFTTPVIVAWAVGGVAVTTIVAMTRVGPRRGRELPDPALDAPARSDAAAATPTAERVVPIGDDRIDDDRAGDVRTDAVHTGSGRAGAGHAGAGRRTVDDITAVDIGPLDIGGRSDPTESPDPAPVEAFVDDAARGSWLGRPWWLAGVGVISALLAAWWVLPFFAKRTYLNDMGWGKIAVHREGQALFGLNGWRLDPDAWFTSEVASVLVNSDQRLWAAAALVGAILSVVFRSRIGTALVLLSIGFAYAFVFVPQGRLWNARLLPFWYLMLYLLAAIGVAEIIRAMSDLWRTRPEPAAVRAPAAGDDAADGVAGQHEAVTSSAPSVPPPSATPRLRWGLLLAAPALAALVALFMAGQLRNMPGGSLNDDGTYRVIKSIGIPGVVSVDVPETLAWDVSGNNFVDEWARWNFTGYERKEAYPEYAAIVSTMEDVGAEHGCGRSLWEYSQDLNQYGTPMALMLLPHWTDGCIGSMEGLYFEASSTTPFHFLMQSELSAGPSRAQRDMPYRPLDLDAGVEHLQLLGVKYYLASTAEAKTAARDHPDLTELVASGPWAVFEVADAPLVEGLAFQPAVTTADESQAEWLGCLEGHAPCPGAALEWFQDDDDFGFDVALTATGPSMWQRVDIGERPLRVPVEPTTVSDVMLDDDSISFRVDQVGSPVLVKASYFPNWTVSGATGPYRAAPNLMVVVPTDTQVELTYARTAVDWAAILLSLVGIALAVLVARRPPLPLRPIRDAVGTVEHDPGAG